VNASKQGKKMTAPVFTKRRNYPHISKTIPITNSMGFYSHEKLFVYTVGEKEIQKIPFRIRDYCWINEEEILYSYQNGIKRYNCATGEKGNFLINFSQLKKIPGIKEFCEKYSIQDCTSLNLTEPQYINGKVYFNLFAFFVEEESVSALLFVDLKKSIGEVLFIHQGGSVRFIVLLDGELISILGDTDINCKTLVLGKEADLEGYYPIQNPKFMSSLGTIQQYYSCS
jgi:hypothetical protein